MRSFRKISLVGAVALLGLGACGTEVLFVDGPDAEGAGGAKATASTGAVGIGGADEAVAVGQGGAGAAGQGGATGGGGLGGGGPATSGVPCPDQACDTNSWCLLCKDQNGDDLEMCRDTLDWPNDVCAEFFGWGPLYSKCDGPEDCLPTEICGIIPGSNGTYAECFAGPDCADDCACGGFSGAICHSLDDCPPCATKCAISNPNDPGLPFTTCQ